MFQQTPYTFQTQLEPQIGSLFLSLQPFLTTNRIEKFISLSQQRTQNIVCVFESTHHCHNISAILRTMDAMGYQDGIFLYDEVPMKFRYQDSVDRGSALWLTLRRAHGRGSLAQFLTERGYRILFGHSPKFF